MEIYVNTRRRCVVVHRYRLYGADDVLVFGFQAFCSWHRGPKRDYTLGFIILFSYV